MLPNHLKHRSMKVFNFKGILMYRQVFILVIMVLTINNKMNSQQVYCRFECNSKIQYGKIEDEKVLALDKAPWYQGKLTGEVFKSNEVKFLHPSEPQVILGLGGAYSDSWKGEKPYHSVRWFLKPPSAAASPNDIVFIPPVVDALKLEVELTIVIGETIKNASENEAKNAIFGYTIGNDIMGWTDSYHEKEGESNDQLDPLLGPGLKIGDRFAPYGPFIYTDFDWKNRERTLVITDVTGKEKVNTSHNTSELIYSPEKIVSDLSKVLTLLPGDIILTGTNKSYIVTSGDTVKIAIEGLGSLTNIIYQKNED